MHAPQWIMLFFCAYDLVTSIRDDGKPRSNTSSVMTLVNVTLVLAILAWGGFFG